eukprot:3064085-Rhodomonas_salina.1
MSTIPPKSKSTSRFPGPDCTDAVGDFAVRNQTAGALRPRCPDYNGGGHVDNNARGAGIAGGGVRSAVLGLAFAEIGWSRGGMRAGIWKSRVLQWRSRSFYNGEGGRWSWGGAR